MAKEKPGLPGRMLCMACAGYTAGIAIFALFSPSVFTIALICILSILTAAFKKFPYFFTLLTVCISLFAGTLHFGLVKSADEKFINQYTGRYLTLSGKITDISFTDNNFQNITVKVNSLTCLDKTEKVNFSASIFTDTEKAFSIGDKITFSDILSPVKKASTHSFDNSLYLRTKGVLASFDPSTNYISVSDSASDFLSRITLFSRNLSGKLQHFIGGEEGTVAAAITLGDTSGLSDHLSHLFRKSGISHIVAVSGMHLTILIGFFFFLAARSRLHFKIRNIFGIILVLLYMFLTGLSPSVTRAGIMIICVLFAAILNRKEDVPTSFFLSAAIILIFNPYTISGASFLLSYLSLAGILVLAEPLRKLIGKIRILPDFITETTSATTAAWFFTSPAIVIMFGGISLVSLPVNIVVLPFINIIFILSFITLATGFFPPLASVIGFILRFFIKTVLLCTEAISAIPYSYINLPKPGFFDILIFIFLLFLIYLLLTGRKSGKYGFAALCVTICYLAFSLTSSALTYTVTFLDIGQGDCILIKAPGQRHYLIDTGPYPGTTLSALRSCGVNKLEAIFISHPDKDHSGALSEILTEIPTQKLILPNYGVRSIEMSALLSTASAAGTNAEFTDRYYNYDFSGIRADVLWPSHGKPGSGMENENSLVLMLDIKGNKFLFTGDIDSATENDIIKVGETVDADVLKASHHGSDGSSSDAFLEKVSANYAVICAGNGNSYGHPHDNTLARLENSGSHILRTDTMGDIKFTIDLFGNMRVDYE